VVTPVFAAQFSPVEHARIFVHSYPRLPDAIHMSEAMIAMAAAAAAVAALARVPAPAQ
jgi:hypothetical protein